VQLNQLPQLSSTNVTEYERERKQTNIKLFFFLSILKTFDLLNIVMESVIELKRTHSKQCWLF